MLLIAEIVLCVTAWRKGWRGWALLPIGAALLVGFIVGVAAESPGGNPDSALPLLLVGDLGCIGALIWMVARAPSSVRASKGGRPSGFSEAPTEAGQA